MTTARSSWRNRSPTALGVRLTGVVVALAALAVAPVSAHRRDEYLQAARVAIDPGRVEIELDLTPGMAIAQRLLGEIDRDGNGVFSADEARAYAARVLSEIHLEVDGRPQPLILLERQFPAVNAVLNGEGTIHLQLAAAVPSLAAGAHRVVFRNVHHPDMGAYLANALLPASERVTVLTQQRDLAQRELVIEYTLRDDANPRLRGWLRVGLGGVIAMMAGLVWRLSASARRAERRGRGATGEVR